MNTPTPTDKTVARLKRRRVRLQEELALVERLLEAAKGPAHGRLAVFTTLPYLPNPGAIPVVLPPFQPALPMIPHYPAPDMGPRWDVQPFQPFPPDLMPFGTRITCGGAFPFTAGDTVFSSGAINVGANGGILQGAVWTGTLQPTVHAPPIVAAVSH